MKVTYNQCAAIMLFCAAAVHTYAKNIDYTPDITSGTYWDMHHIAAVRITALRMDDNGAELVTYQLERQFSQGLVETTGSAPASHFWFGRDPANRPELAAGDNLIIFLAKEEPAPIVAAKAGDSDSSRLATLNRISALRENPGNLPAYLNAVLSSDPLVARYSLRYLLDQSASLQAAGDYVAKLAQLRDDTSRESQDRILAARLVARINGSDENSVDEYARLQAALVNSASTEWTELSPFVHRLIEFDNRRTETITRLTQLATNPAASPAVRIAAYNAFENPRLFRFESPDEDSSRIFQACVALLQDPDPAMRRAGAALLHNIAAGAKAAGVPDFVAASSHAIAEALAVETDGVTQHHLSRYLQLLSTR